MRDTPSKTTCGLISERQAADYLIKKGFKPITNNYRCPYGEIDLIMQDKEIMVFIEVRFRQERGFGDALESIDSRKQQKLLKSATHYLQKHHLIDEIDCRFDVIGFSNGNIEWIKDAFSYE